MGTNRAALIRFLVQTFTVDFNRRGMKSLPHAWEEIMRNADGRTSAASDSVHSLNETPAPLALKKLRNEKYPTARELRAPKKSRP